MFIFEHYLGFWAILKCNHSPSTKRLSNIHCYKYSKEATTLLRGYTCWTNHFSNSITYILCHFIFFINLVGISWTWTQRVALLNCKSLNGPSPSYLWRTTKCLSKLHGSLLIILSTSTKLSKTKRTLWSPKFQIWNPFVECQSSRSHEFCS